MQEDHTPSWGWALFPEPGPSRSGVHRISPSRQEILKPFRVPAARGQRIRGTLHERRPCGGIRSVFCHPVAHSRCATPLMSHGRAMTRRLPSRRPAGSHDGCTFPWRRDAFRPKKGPEFPACQEKTPRGFLYTCIEVDINIVVHGKPGTAQGKSVPDRREGGPGLTGSGCRRGENHRFTRSRVPRRR